MSKKVAVIAVGGNSLIKDPKRVTVEDQELALVETANHVVDMVEAGWDVAIGHGNGPQVGYILRRSEIAAKVEGMHEVPLDVCGADSQGAIGYEFQQALQNELFRRGIKKNACIRECTLTLYPNCRLTLQRSRSLASTVAALREQPIPIVLCDMDEDPEAWQEILRATRDFAAPPSVIVTSRNADDRLWAEMLNAGAFDLLSKPFDQSNVIRILHSAWIHWQNRHGQREAVRELQEPASGV